MYVAVADRLPDSLSDTVVRRLGVPLLSDDERLPVGGGVVDCDGVKAECDTLASNVSLREAVTSGDMDSVELPETVSDSDQLADEV